MVTVSQAVVAAYVVGAIGILIGAVIVATVRADLRSRRNQHGREVYPPTRLERILREDAADNRMTCEEARRYFRLDDAYDVLGGDDD